MAKAGKPEVIFTEKDLKQIETMSGFGMSLNQMASILGISKSTLDRRIAENNKSNPINDAIQKGKGSATYNVIRSAYQMAISGHHPSMTMFWLKCRNNWSELGKAENEDEEVYEI